MADIRIKDLTTTASSTASDDFIAVDGATNGTRKLNAYSPSFGGSATVAGTLAVTKSNGGNTTGAANAAISLPTDESTIQGPGTYTQIRMGGNLVLGSSNETLIQVNQVNAIRINSSQQVQVPTTTASTSTSTGALVVSGGVGVAGKIYAGSNISTAATLESTAGAVESVATDSYFNLRAGATLQGYVRGYSPSAEIYFYNARSGPLILGTNNTTALTLTSAQKAEFAATIKTAAPSGGTAAEWKLGTVATVSPTSPNRTIEVDIGGTIYYIHAKTTNN